MNYLWCKTPLIMNGTIHYFVETVAPGCRFVTPNTRHTKWWKPADETVLRSYFISEGYTVRRSSTGLRLTLAGLGVWPRDRDAEAASLTKRGLIEMKITVPLECREQVKKYAAELRADA